MPEPDVGGDLCRAQSIYVGGEYAARITKEVAVNIFLAKKTARRKQDRLAMRLAAEHGITAKAVRDIWSLRTWRRETEQYWTDDDRERPRARHRASGAARRARGARSLEIKSASVIAAMDVSEEAHAPPRDTAHFLPAEAPVATGHEEGAEDGPGPEGWEDSFVFPVSVGSDMAQELWSEWAAQAPLLADDGARGCAKEWVRQSCVED